MSILNTIKQLCEQTIKSIFPDQYKAFPANFLEITEATQKRFGHYQCNSAMKLTKIVKLPPMEIANLMKENLMANTTIFKEINLAAPGFINFVLHEKYIAELINAQVRDPRQGVSISETKKRVVIDFSSPNIAKEMHVGHLRSTIIGDSIARILSFLGHDVLRLNHLGDWGTQFGMLIAYLKQKFTDPLNANMDLTELVDFYRESKELFDNDAQFKIQAQQEVVALQNGDPNSKAVWEKICIVSKKAYQEIYDLLDIEIIDRGESFYNPFLFEIIKILEEKDLIEISDGAKCVYPEGFVNREGKPLPLIVQKSDGGYNYATTDLAAINHRVSMEKGTWIIYVTDIGQSQHFSMVFNAAKKANLYGSDVILDHVPFGLVLKDDGKKFKTRSGETERLIDLLFTAINKAKQLLQQRNSELSNKELEQAAKCLGINAIKYADLSNNRINNYIFSYDKMLQFEGNTAAFLAYAYVRIKSIQRKIAANIEQLSMTTQIKLTKPTEIDLALHASKFNDALNSTVKELLPNRLTDYLFNLAEKFHAFFHQCKVSGSDEQDSRLLLCTAVLHILERGFALLGLTTLEKM